MVKVKESNNTGTERNKRYPDATAEYADKHIILA